jgi:hypothetical protein
MDDPLHHLRELLGAERAGGRTCGCPNPTFPLALSALLSALFPLALKNLKPPSVISVLKSDNRAQFQEK